MIDSNNNILPGTTPHEIFLRTGGSIDRIIKGLDSKEKEFSKDRKKLDMSDDYTPLHPYLYRIHEDIFDPEFLDALNTGTLSSIIKKETDNRVYSFPFLSKRFSRDLLEEIEHYKKTGLPVRRPNSMNRFGIILDDIGFNTFLQDLMVQYVRPVAGYLYPEWGGNTLDDHHGFIVEYEKEKKDEELSYHMDESEITLNVCLGKKFTGGGLFFQGIRGTTSEHLENINLHWGELGRAIIHLGQHFHGANRIQSGERYNLILWCRSSVYRASSAEKYVHQCKSISDNQHDEL